MTDPDAIANPSAPRMTYYGCTKCQKHHYSDEPIYKQHIYFQDKHSIREMRVERRIEMLLAEH